MKWAIIDSDGYTVAITEGSEPTQDELQSGCTYRSATDDEQCNKPFNISETRKIQQMRRQRSRLLKQTDWTQLQDVPAETTARWREYRQQLRDLPANIADIDNINWPEAPV